MMNLCLVSCKHGAKETKTFILKIKKKKFQTVIVVLIMSYISLNVVERTESC